MAFSTIDGKKVPLTDYTAQTEAGVRAKIARIAWKSEGYRGSFVDRMGELNLLIQPIYVQKNGNN